MTELPVQDVTGDVAAAEELLQSALEALESVRRSSQSVAAAVASGTEQAGSLAKQLARSNDERRALEADATETKGELATLEETLTALLGKGDPVELVRLRRESLGAAREVAEAARKAAERARSEHDQAIRDEQTATKQLTEMAMAATRVASALGFEFDPSDQTSQGFGDALSGLRAYLAAVTAALADEAERLQAGRTQAGQARTELLETVGVSGSIDDVITGLGAKVETLAGQISAVEKDLAGAAGARQRLDELQDRGGHFDRVVADLTDARFVRYLLDDERIRLAGLGSEHFQLLSSGRYRFSDEGKFNIIDLTTADVVRKADSQMELIVSADEGTHTRRYLLGLGDDVQAAAGRARQAEQLLQERRLVQRPLPLQRQSQL